MKLSLIRRSLVAPAALSLVTLIATVSLQAQGPDASKVEVKTTKVADNFYTLEGLGGTVGVLAGPDGVLMVDTQFATMSDKLVAAIKQISPSPIRFVINTHVHGDHTGGNANFGKLGATIFARDEVRERLIHPQIGPNGQPDAGAPEIGLPVVTYEDTITFHMDSETVDAIPVRKAHTDGDTMVYFHNADALMVGDFYRSIGYPNIDRVNGGTLDGTLAALAEVIALAGPNTKIIPGHGPTVDRNAVVAQRDMILALRDEVAKQIQQGKTLQEVIAAHPTAAFDAKVAPAAPNGERNADRFVGQLYAELALGK